MVGVHPSPDDAQEEEENNFSDTDPDASAENCLNENLANEDLEIEDLEEVRDLALPELLEGDSVTVIEWGDQIIPAIPQNYLEIRFEYGYEENERNVTISHIGVSWHERIEKLQEALTEWGIKP